MTLEEKLAQAGGRPAGFDYMRLFLALSIVGFHSIVTTYGYAAQGRVHAGPWRPLEAMALPMFFSLSGFLVAGSFERCKTMISFLGLRLLRLIPALAGEVLVSALILGPWLTKLPLADYFSDPQFHRYFLNILGEIHYTLPGVFVDNPFYQVNGQLWTVPYELICYVTLVSLAFAGIIYRRQLFLRLLLAANFLYFLLCFYRPDDGTGPVSGKDLVASFVCGLLIYLYRDRIRWNRPLFLLSLISFVLLLTFPNGDRFVAFPAAYATIYLGLLNPPRQKILLSGDYSYGIFLYGFPIQQAVVAVFHVQHWYANLLLAYPLTIMAAVISWWGLEKHALKLRGLLKKLESAYLERSRKPAPILLATGV
jgi:peptidoglycan/LPS O-acetylase OafA/YrhL